MFAFLDSTGNLVVIFRAWPNPYRKAAQLREQLLKDGLQLHRVGTEVSRGHTWAASLWKGQNTAAIAAQLPKPSSHGSLSVGLCIQWR